jgi:hypothetical protein
MMIEVMTDMYFIWRMSFEYLCRMHSGMIP